MEKKLSEPDGFPSQFRKKMPKPMPRFTPRQIYEQLDRYVIGQDTAKRKVAIAAYNHVKRIENNLYSENEAIKKSNILLYGPTGCGKTHLARILANVLDLPLVTVDATDYTEAGYYGKDVETIIGELLLKTESVEETERGIVFIDEIDKIASRAGGARTGAGNRDIGGEGVQQALLKLLEGKTIFAPVDVTQHWNRHDFVPVDVSNILFICAGAFSDLGVDNSKDIQGFGLKASDNHPVSKKIDMSDFLKYGFMPEFIGRLPVRIAMRALSHEELLRVLTEPPDSILKEYKLLLSLDEITLNLEGDALDSVIRFVAHSPLGARSLRTVMEEVLEDVMFSSPELRGKSITLTSKMVEEKVARLEL